MFTNNREGERDAQKGIAVISHYYPDPLAFKLNNRRLLRALRRH
jgi:hypothetical protein